MRRLLKSKAIFQIFLVITLAFFTANIITKDVKAQTDEGENCCRDLGNEQYCQGINNPDGCAEGYVPTSCEYVNGCEQGCCNLIDKGGGCSKGVSQVGCDEQGGKWTNDKLCGYDQECVSGCCVVGSNQAYLTIEDDCDGEFR